MNILSVIFLINVIQGFFLASILAFNLKKQKKSNLFLVILITIISLYQIKAIIVLEGYYNSFPFLIQFFLPFHFLLGPLFFFYIKYTASIGDKFKKKDVLHFIPAVICLLTLLPFYLKSGAEKLAIYSHPEPDNFSVDSQKIYYYVPILISIIFYCWKSWTFIKSKNKKIDGRANKDYLEKLIWLQKYTTMFLVFICCFLGAFLIFVFTDFHQFYVMLATVFASSILIHYIAYWTIKESGVMQNHATTTKTTKGILMQDRILDLKKEIVSILEDEQLFLNSDLTARYFCERLKINSHYLSQIINNEFQCNMSYLINSYRVSYAQNIIKSGAYNHLNFLGIANMSGFNSANAFARVFKQHVGQTPSQFKKCHAL
ncbi:helix-turn-helix domain-containing protein [uncultured Psychroserpens sp.]|uniref:helix-turn-helix domain-containing protein n=1 Tax=uncultured Psychroserpens sp. TaxID=255436 RepID=UPI0026220ED1|nr:helix-turn-helix domain-containing protein [uncultured Psychroserpens sp.]